MAKRISLSKSERYEILKRDSFTCQYCGAKAPDVILEVDHIIPVAEGGTNDAFNLITSCRDCNRGKGKKLLSDNTTIEKQRKQLDDMNAIREQSEMMIQWRSELLEVLNTETESAEDYMHMIGMLEEDQHITDSGKVKLRDWIKRFGYAEVTEAIGIACDRYMTRQNRGVEYAFDKIGGICWNRKYQKRE